MFEFEHFIDPPEIANWYWTGDFNSPRERPPLAKGQSRTTLFTDA